MIREEIILMLGWLKAQDPRIQQNDPSVDVWDVALRPFSAHEVRQVLERHIITNPEPPRPADIRKATIAYVEYQRARQSAIEPPKPDLTEAAQTAYMNRHMDRPEFRTLILKGRDTYRAKLRARGITPHTETCPTCARNAS